MHDKPVQEIIELLEDIGYEVDSTVPETRQNQGKYVQPTRRTRKDLDPQARLDRAHKHRQNCEQCQLEDQKSAQDETADSTPQNEPEQAFVVTDQSGSHGLFEVSLSVEGMTCASCVGTISKALDKTAWVETANINLLSASATVQVHGDNHNDELVELIEDLGYDASIQGVKEVAARRNSHGDTSGADAPEAVPLRTVDLHIEGMYCHHCPSKIDHALADLDQPELTIARPATMDDNVVSVRYRPNGPDFTVRDIIAALASVDPAFNVTITHPPTLEQRAREMHRREQRRLLLRICLSLAIAIPTFIIGIVFMDLVHASNSSRMYLMQELHGVQRAEWAMFILATPVYFLCADIFHKRAFKEIKILWHPRSKVPILRRFYRFGSMSMLLSFGTTIAYVSSIVEVAIVAAQNSGAAQNLTSNTYFDSVVFLTFFLLIGRYIESYSKTKSGDAVAALGKLRATEAILVDKEGAEAKVGLDLLDIGDTVIVPRGASPPCDGVILSGNGTFDESSLTGESKPVTKKVGDQVFSGTINNGDALKVRVTGAADSSMLDQIISAVRDGQTKRAPVERVVDSLTSYFVPAVTLIAIATWIIWLGLGQGGALPDSWKDISYGGWPFWSLQFAIAVFVVACPCGIGLAAPTALMVGGGLAAKHGILVKGGGEAFQEASRLDCIVFDKTGTLTMGGQPKVTDSAFFASELSEQTVLAAVAALESGSSHPIAKALIAHATEQNATAAEVVATEEVPGKGMKGTVTASGQTLEVLVGNAALMKTFSVPLQQSHSDTANKWSSEAKSVVFVALKQDTSFALAALFSISDPIRPEAKSVLASLRQLGIAVYMLTGDNALTAAAVGQQLDLPAENIIADVLPADKAAKVQSLRASLPSESNRPRAVIAMVGDGINDAPALATADVGIAIGSGSDVAISAAHFVLVRSDLRTLLTLARLSRKVFNRVKANFVWALVYNAIALPVAAGCFYPIVSNGTHVRLDPVWAALAMAASSVSVVGSSLMLRSGVPLLGFREKRE